MSEEPIVAKSTMSRVFSRIVWTVLGLFLVLLLLGVSSIFFVILEAPFHFLIGWLIHFVTAVPPLLGSWWMILLPIGCLMVAGFLLHRFVRWWIKAKGNGIIWQPVHTVTALGIFLLGCGAAIAMSGVVHQLVWLSKDPWTEDRSRKSYQTEAVNNARQLLFALFEFQETEGRQPDSLQELEGKYQIPRRLCWVRTSGGKVPEPFVLLYPGGTESEAKKPWIVSPLIGSVGNIVVGYSDGSVTSLPAGSLEKILQSRDFKTGNEPAR
jgi:hypothetical protein